MITEKGQHRRMCIEIKCHASRLVIRSSARLVFPSPSPLLEHVGQLIDPLFEDILHYVMHISHPQSHKQTDRQTGRLSQTPWIHGRNDILGPSHGAVPRDHRC